MDNTILKMKNIHKKFPGVYALNSVNFDLKYGEVHALLGENGAGKSTLIKILAGLYKVDDGEIFIKGEKCNIKGVNDSQARGISVIHQELCLVPYMTVAENIFLGREKVSKVTRFVKAHEIISETQRILSSLGIEIKPTAKINTLSIAQQQMVEIAKALSFDTDIIVMDEPTACLTDKEVDMLFKTINDLKQKNISVIYISHRMEELFQITDRVTIMRDGKYITTKITAETNKNELIAMMVGRKLSELYKKENHELGEIIFEVKELNTANLLKDISFSLRKGEILGISGLVGAGRTNLARALFGVDRYESGSIFLEKNELAIKKPSDSMESGIALVPEDRKGQGLVLCQSVGYNITLPVLKKFLKFIGSNKEIEISIISKYIEMLAIKTPSENQLAGNLSGGNQQKIVIAKWIATSPKVLILDEPTRGVDVGAKAEIYAIINMLAKQGVGIIMISSELPEIINISDRVLVMCQGQITRVLDRAELDQKTIMQYATGGIGFAS